MPGALKLDYLQQMLPILFHFFYAQEENWEFYQPLKNLLERCVTVATGSTQTAISKRSTTIPWLWHFGIRTPDGIQEDET